MSCRLLPLVYKNKFPIYSMPRNILHGLHPYFSIHRLWNHMGMQSPDGNETAEVTALIVWLVVLIQPHLCGRPALQIACAVDGAEAFSICWKAKARGECHCWAGSRVQSQKTDKRKGLTLQRSHLVGGAVRSGPASCVLSRVHVPKQSHKKPSEEE